MDELEETVIIDKNEITANDREVLMSYNIGSQLYVWAFWYVL